MTANENDEPATGPNIEEGLAKLCVREGDVVLGKYRLVALLAASVTGAVFLAVHVDLGHEVAVKLLLEPFNQDSEARARFSREAKLMSKIESDHVVRIIDVGELGDGTPVMAMESLRGEDLRLLLRKNPNGIEIPRAVDLALQACLGLGAAHARGIVHRDIKPSNLFLTRREDGSETLKILDFGIAKMRAGSASLSDALTNPTALVGSPRYMAPEQITSASSVDPRADVWALAAILQELLTGRPVFGVKGVPNVLRMIVSEPPVPLRVSLPRAPASLEIALVRALTRELAKRTPDVAAFARDLAPHASATGRLLAPRVERVLGSGGAATSSPAPISSSPTLTAETELEAVAPPAAPEPPAPLAPVVQRLGPARPIAVALPGLRRRPSRSVAVTGLALALFAITVALLLVSRCR